MSLDLLPLQSLGNQTTYNLTWIFIGVYVLIMIYLAYKGFVVTQREEDMRTFTLAKGYLGPITLGLAWSAGFASAITFLGLPGFAYASGASAIPWITVGWWGPAILGIVLVARKFRQMGDEAGSLSVPEWIGDRYDNQYLTIIFAVLVLVNVFYIAAQFTGLALLFESLLGIPYEAGAVGALVFVIAYVGVGGTYTDVVTDFLQALVMALVAASIFVATFIHFGGPFNLISQVGAESPELGELFNPGFKIFSTPWQVLGIMVAGFTTGVLPQLGNKFLSLRRERDVKVFIFSAMLGLLVFNLAIFSGPMAYLLDSGLESADQATILVIIELFPPVITALFGIALISATVSTTDGLMVSVGTAIGNDVYRNFVTEEDEEVPDPVERKSVWITRATILVMGVVAAGLALTRPDFIAILTALSLFGFLPAAAPPIFIGLYWDGANAKGTFASAIIGPLTFLGWYQGWWLDVAMVYSAGAVAALVSAAAFIVVSVLTNGSSPLADRMPTAE